jgi:hypothetical protein
MIMFDDLEQLQGDPGLFYLLAHYAAATLDREVWQDRVMQLDGVSVDALVKLHGRLLARDWIEQNTGSTMVLRRGAVPGCYRVTTAGMRAWKQARAGFETEEKRECVNACCEHPCES